jgi:cytochrome d ubiquinol oxidase subunit I
LFGIHLPGFHDRSGELSAVLEGLWLWTGKDVYLDTFRYWLKIFAVAFAMGVVSGIVMSYQFGTNWSVFSDKTGPVLGPLLDMRCSPPFSWRPASRRHALRHEPGWPRPAFLATCLVAIGTAISAFWILSANSWMHTPAAM